MDLPQPLVGLDLQPGQRRQAAAVWYARERSLENIADRLEPGHERAACGLLAPHRSSDVGLALEAALDVPLGAPVPPEHQPRGGHRRSSTPSWIAGQSRHSRSSA